MSQPQDLPHLAEGPGQLLAQFFVLWLCLGTFHLVLLNVLAHLRLIQAIGVLIRSHYH
jgi:hypothetical protein